jgi:hypothetical protein
VEGEKEAHLSLLAATPPSTRRPETYYRSPKHAINNFLATRMTRLSNATAQPLPQLIQSTGSSGLEDDDSDDDREEDEQPLEVTIASQSSRRFTPFAAPKYQIPPHLAHCNESDEAHLSEEDEVSCRRVSPLPLPSPVLSSPLFPPLSFLSSFLPQLTRSRSSSPSISQTLTSVWDATPLTSEPTLLFKASVCITPCSSCNTVPILSTTNFVQLQPCNDILCDQCLTTLVNGVSNEPSRPGNCFTHGTQVETFIGVSFVGEEKKGEVKEEEDDEGVFSSPKTTISTLFGTPKSVRGLSPFRKIDWSEPFSTPGSSHSPSSIKNFAWVVYLLSSISSRALTRRGLRHLTGLRQNPRSRVRLPGTLFAWTTYVFLICSSLAELTLPLLQVPWDIKISDVESWIPSSVATLPSDVVPISILCNRFVVSILSLARRLMPFIRRSDGRTLSQLYIELPSREAAQSLVRLQKGKKLQGRPVSVVLATNKELHEHVSVFVSLCFWSTPSTLSSSDRSDSHSTSRRSSPIGNLDSMGLTLLSPGATERSSPRRNSTPWSRSAPSR